MPDKFTYSANNIIGLILLLVIFSNIKINKRKTNYSVRLYLRIIFSTSLIMILDIALNAINGQSGYLIREIHIIVTAIYFILNPVPYLTWSLYTDFYFYKSKKRLKKIALFYVIPAAISAVLCILSIFNGRIFFIDKNNLYHRGNLFWLNVILYYMYPVTNYIQIITNRKSLRKKEYYSLLTFITLPTIAGVLQIIDTSQTFLWLGISISVLIIYLNIQNEEIYEDYLTGLYNRRQLDIYLKNCIKEQEESESIFVIMLDINDFKVINDTYGHVEGDKALKHVAKILMKSFRAEDFISRYAGDEFVIIAKLEDENIKGEMIDRLKRNIKEFNETNKTPYDISVSLGYGIYDPELKMDADNFIIYIDRLMYQDKARIKKLS